MKKKMLSLALALVMCLGLALPASAYEMGKVGENNIISVGGSHTSFIDKNYSLWTWGLNSYGQLGNGTTANSSTPVKVLDNVAAVSCGTEYTAAIKTDGSLWMWGWNFYGQLGNGGGGNETTSGNGSFQTVPVKVLDNVAAVSCGNHHTAAIKTDGSLWVWGSNGNGQLGNGTTANSSTPVKVLDNVAAVSCGGSHTAAIKTDGSLWTWGSNGNGQLGNGGVQVDNGFTAKSLTPVKVMDNVLAVSCGGNHTAALKTDSSLWAWGHNEYGQLGNGSGNVTSPSGEAIQTVPVKVLDGVVAVNCGSLHTAVLKADSSLWTWGSDNYGQVGNGVATSSSPPVKVLDNVAAVSCGVSHTATLKTDGSLWTCGFNAHGQLGFEGGNSTYFGYPNQIVPKQVKGLTASVSATVPEQPTSGTQVSDWAKEQVKKAAENGLVPDGLGDNYQASITRAQFAATAVKLYEAMSGQKAPVAGESPFTDTSDTAVIQAQALGIVSGVGDGKFLPNALVARQEAALMLSRVYTKLGGNIPKVASTTFADNDKISSWARDAVAFMADKGIVNGVGNNQFAAQGNASIEQALIIALRMFDNLK